jgi:uridine kinase
MKLKNILFLILILIALAACSGSGKVVVSDVQEFFGNELSGIIHLYQYSASGRDSSLVDLRGIDLVLRDSTNFELEKTRIGNMNDFRFRSNELVDQNNYSIEFTNVNTFIIEITYRESYELHIILNNDGLMNISDRRIERRSDIGNPPIIE